MSLGETMMNWLRRVETDQNLQGIGQLDDTIMDDTQRRWFRRQDLTPTLPTGYYDEVTGKYVIGHPSPSQADAVKIATDTIYSTTSAQDYTITVPANTAYKITYIAALNGTRAPRHTLIYTPSGGTAATLINQGAGAGTQSELVGLVGTGPFGAGNIIGQPINPIWMQAGDTMLIRDALFQAADTRAVAVVFETYTV